MTPVVSDKYFPITQSVHAALPAAAAAAYFPPPHTVHDEAPGVEYKPAAQTLQSEMESCDAAADELSAKYRPAPHTVHEAEPANEA